jgi:hypothetical protein
MNRTVLGGLAFASILAAGCGGAAATDVSQQNAAAPAIVTADPTPPPTDPPTPVPTPLLSACAYAIHLPDSSLTLDIVYHLVDETCARYDSGLASGTRGKNLTALSLSPADMAKVQCTIAKPDMIPYDVLVGPDSVGYCSVAAK